MTFARSAPRFRSDEEVPERLHGLQRSDDIRGVDFKGLKIHSGNARPVHHRNQRSLPRAVGETRVQAAGA
jgi:hypothetical protein